MMMMSSVGLFMVYSTILYNEIITRIVHCDAITLFHVRDLTIIIITNEFD